MKRKLLQWLVSQQTEELDIDVKCKMILEVRLVVVKGVGDGDRSL